MNTGDVYYLFYDQTNQYLKKLNLLELREPQNDTLFVSFPFILNGQYACNKQDLVNLVNEHNEKVFFGYEQEFKIKPPYSIKHVYAVDGHVNVSIRYKKHNFLFYEDVKNNLPNHETLEPFFSKHKDLKFCGFYMKKLHKFIMNNRIVRPDPRPDYFNIVMKGKIYTAHIYRVNINHCFLSFPLTENRYVFDCYNISEDEVLNVLGISEWQGDWPETPESLVYVLLDYINENRMAEPVVDRIKIDGNKIITSFAEFEIKQTKTGKWYIRGNIEQICLLFKVPDNMGLKHLVNKILGNKIRHGVFPECDSREEVTKLLKMIKDDR